MKAVLANVDYYRGCGDFCQTESCEFRSYNEQGQEFRVHISGPVKDQLLIGQGEENDEFDIEIILTRKPKPTIPQNVVNVFK